MGEHVATWANGPGTIESISRALGGYCRQTRIIGDHEHRLAAGGNYWK